MVDYEWEGSGTGVHLVRVESPSLEADYPGVDCWDEEDNSGMRSDEPLGRLAIRSQVEVANEMGISRSMVRKIEDRAIRKIREGLAAFRSDLE
jgi:hypothetical protein